MSLCARCMRGAKASLIPFSLCSQSTVPAPTFSMPVTVPVSSQSPLPFSNPNSLVTTSFVTSTLTDPRLLSPQQPQLQRNTVSPGLPQRPASAGKKDTQIVSTLKWIHLVTDMVFSVLTFFEQYIIMHHIETIAFMLKHSFHFESMVSTLQCM